MAFVTDDPAAVALKDVTRAFGRRTVIDHASVTINRGELFGLLGPSGSGKTTLIKIMAGIDRADSGEAHMLGTPMPKLAMLHRFGYMAQSDALYMELTGRQNMAFFGKLYGLRRAVLNRRIEETAALVGLSEHLGKPAAAYSGGMKRRLSLAIALLHEPELLVLDEPTVGIDPVLRQSIWQELHSLSRNGTTIIVTTHVMDEAAQCDRLGLMREGRFIAVGTPESLLQQTGTSSIEEAFITLGQRAEGGVQA
ncbi:ABC transporter ATP-binding protein [Paenibacillus sp. MMS18-CY102]|uniref:ABC transporter ATP-binding protein n=1 Tax=Paenibacillus sp. MMS18-CY102 TaxID=2682849 RepID=UPI001366295A|nr:ABC transporter ATP-binding protein [Paenibacillus sp. MMS18-CY102]MWC26784.1 ATP-binding cassette domain-containing protein [Paenibacillus sp. MMS18-CY102]